MSIQNVCLLSLTVKATAVVPPARFANLAGTVSGAGLYSIGPSKFLAAIGDNFTVDTIGTGVVECGGTVAVGGLLESDATGRAVPRTTGVILARALQAGTVGRFIEVLLIAN